MAASRLMIQPRTAVPQLFRVPRRLPGARRQLPILPPSRTFTSSPARCQQPHRKETFRARLGTALNNTKIEWYWIPATAGIAFIGGVQAYRTYSTAKAKREEEDRASHYNDEEYEPHEPGKKPKKRKRIKPSGPWYVRWD